MKNYAILFLTSLLVWVAPESKADSLPGITAVDVTLNLEEKGFKTSHSSTVLGQTWRAKLDIDGTKYEAEAFGEASHLISSITATVSVPPGKDAGEIAKSFLAMMATLPYDGSRPDEAKSWVLENAGKHDVSHKIGTVTFHLYATSSMCWLEVRPAE